MEKITIRKKHPLAIRWFHWVNFPLLMLMIWSGTLIYWAWDPYKVQIGSWTLLQFYPTGFYKALNIPQRLAEGMAWHFALMWLFFINGFMYVLFTIVSGEWRHLLPNKHSFKEAWHVLLHDLGIRKKPLPEVKFNGAQRIAYTSIVVMGIGSVLSGLAIYKPTQLSWITALFGDYDNARLVHFILTIGYCLFFLVHVAQVVRAGWNNFQAMVTGWQVVSTPAEEANVDPVTTNNRAS
ncbi:MAG: cytochrome b/b6 domain-containing protein [Flavobacteriales bacterium]